MTMRHVIFGFEDLRCLRVAATYRLCMIIIQNKAVANSEPFGVKVPLVRLATVGVSACRDGR